MNNEKIEKIQEIASRCLSCKAKPCRNGCPLTNDITEFIKYIKRKEYKKAYEVLLDTTVLQPICGRICPHFKQCQGSCIRGIKGEAVGIGELEAFIRRYGNRRKVGNRYNRRKKE